jgi:cell division protein FtsB
MARNRKYQAAHVRLVPALYAFLLCAGIAIAGVGYVWQKQQINELGKQILAREKKLDELRDQSEKLRRQLATLRSPQFIEMRIKELNLGLVQPQPNQVWRLSEPAGDAETAATPSSVGFNGRQYAASYISEPVP